MVYFKLVALKIKSKFLEVEFSGLETDIYVVLLEISKSSVIRIITFGIHGNNGQKVPHLPRAWPAEYGVKLSHSTPHSILSLENTTVSNSLSLFVPPFLLKIKMDGWLQWHTPVGFAKEAESRNHEFEASLPYTFSFFPPFLSAYEGTLPKHRSTNLTAYDGANNRHCHPSPQDETQVHLTFLSMLPSLFHSPEPFSAPPSNAPFKGCLDDQISILQDSCLGSFCNCGNLK